MVRIQLNGRIALKRVDVFRSAPVEIRHRIFILFHRTFVGGVVVIRGLLDRCARFLLEFLPTLLARFGQRFGCIRAIRFDRALLNGVIILDSLQLIIALRACVPLLLVGASRRFF